MKKILASFIALSGLFAVTGFATPADAKAEIQIFVNYRGSNDYDTKVVSTWQNPASAELVYVEADEDPMNAACYKGDPDEALELFSSMVDIFNENSGRELTVWGEHYFDDDLGTRALVIWERDETGVTTTWFQRMRECVRWSTPAERAQH